jgi:hypothetical protein
MQIILSIRHLFMLQCAVDRFRQAQRNYAVYGTGESEPYDLFQLLLVRAQMDLPSLLPAYAVDWGLPPRPGSQEAADALNHPLQVIFDLIGSCPLHEKEAMHICLADVRVTLTLNFEESRVQKQMFGWPGGDAGLSPIWRV